MTIGWRTAWFAIFVLALALRLLRLSWQPLWWDEGYSIYFATDPLTTMLALTAQDIHPPFYYLLLHFWFNWMGSATVESARLLSIAIGVATLPAMTWVGLSLWPARRSLAWLATLLLAVSPIHIYYSQEIRMYGLALLLTLLSSTLLWQMQQCLEQEQRPYLLAAAYIFTSALALLTLYYTGFLLLAHQLWALTVNRHNQRRQFWHLAAALLILMAQLPWWLYAFPKLFPYIADKVVADQDVALPIWQYIWRHWLAFFSGHVAAQQPWLEIARIATAALSALAIPLAFYLARQRNERKVVSWLLSLLLIPALVGFAVNLYYPFFPVGGERLLLQLLPYLLLLAALTLGKLFTTRPTQASLLLAPLLLAAAVGITIYFITPRYAEHDYRPIIADVMQQSRPDDTVLALFPWQTGYWRAYSPRENDGTLLAPQPAPVDQTILKWDEAFAASVDAALQQGTIWFPMPLSFGSTLPEEIEAYLLAHARNLENYWFSPATRLTAWVQIGETPELRAVDARFQDAVTLQSGGIAPHVATSSNTPIAVDLCWQPPVAHSDLRATLRLLDAGGFTWAKRDLTPLAHFAGTNGAMPCLEQIALNIPVGLPPGDYQVVVGVGQRDSDQLISPQLVSQGEAQSQLIPIGELTISAPDKAISPQRLPMTHPLATPATDAGLRLLGHAGVEAGASLLAGDEVPLLLFLQNSVDQPPRRHLYLSLLDNRGRGVAGWQGWPLEQYTTEIWKPGALAQVPLVLPLPPDLVAGRYSLVAGFVDPDMEGKSAPAVLNSVEVVRRPASFAAPATEYTVSPPPAFGTHASLIGYDLAFEGASLTLQLIWHVTQPLLPPHHIFVHLLDASGTRIAQSDGEPITNAGRAPTGSWLTNEYLTTQHTLTVPDAATAPFTTPFTIQLGLYLPTTGQRLPVTINGAVTGDSATISLPLAP